MRIRQSVPVLMKARGPANRLLVLPKPQLVFPSWELVLRVTDELAWPALPLAVNCGWKRRSGGVSNRRGRIFFQLGGGVARAFSGFVDGSSHGRPQPLLRPYLPISPVKSLLIQEFTHNLFVHKILRTIFR